MNSLIILAILATGVMSFKLTNDTENYAPSLSTGRIVNGHEAGKHQAPYIVSLHATLISPHFCAGSIIRDNRVLTAAHCIISPTIYATAGLHDRTARQEGQTVKVAKAIVHENYILGTNGPFDIALLKLEEGFLIDGITVGLILPNQRKLYSGELGFIFGWGLTNPLLGSLPKMLQTATTIIYSAEDCRKIAAVPQAIASTNICSASIGLEISACMGDSGGPFISVTAELIGIVSWGPALCGKNDRPAVYTNVMSYEPWIRKNII